MFFNRKKSISNDRLDQAGRDLVRLTRENDEASEAAASSPFVLAKLKARIAAERGRPPMVEVSIWSALVGVSAQAVPAFVMVAAMFFVMVETNRTNLPPPSDLATAEPPDTEIARILSINTCTITTKPDCVVSEEEVLFSVVARARREVQK